MYTTRLEMTYKSWHPLYRTWRDMHSRCLPGSPHRRHYYDRGIKVCQEWCDFWVFVTDMEPRPFGATLDRRHDDRGYYKENCHWATRKQQQRNQTVTRRVIVSGRKYVAADLADIAGVKTDTIIERSKAGLPYRQVISKKRRINLTGFKLGAKASSIARKARTHCKQGHEYTPQNMRQRTEGKYTWRTCLACEAAKIARRKYRK